VAIIATNSGQKLIIVSFLPCQHTLAPTALPTLAIIRAAHSIVSTSKAVEVAFFLVLSHWGSPVG